MVPRWYKGNAWGPKANADREAGVLPTIPNNPEMTAWAAWGRANLREGDIVLRMGDARAAMGLLPFSKISAAIAGSRFSHSGIVAFEDGEPVVYDTTTTGPQLQPFPVWLLDTRGSLAIKRPKPEYQGYVPSAVAFCRSVYASQTPFDYDMAMGDDHLYCIELTERAYTQAGLPLSNAVRLDELPRYGDFPWIVRLLKLATPMVPSQLAYVIGNENLGIWSSPALDLVYDAPDAKPPAALAGAVAPDVVRR